LRTLLILVSRYPKILRGVWFREACKSQTCRTFDTDSQLPTCKRSREAVEAQSCQRQRFSKRLQEHPPHAELHPTSRALVRLFPRNSELHEQCRDLLDRVHDDL